MKLARILIVACGMLIPYLARTPKGLAWLRAYLDVGLGGNLIILGGSAIVCLALLTLTWVYRNPRSLIFPCLITFSFLAWAHFSFDLSVDAQAGLAFIFFPIYATVLALAGGIVGFAIDRSSKARSVA